MGNIEDVEEIKKQIKEKEERIKKLENEEKDEEIYKKIDKWIDKIIPSSYVLKKYDPISYYIAYSDFIKYQIEDLKREIKELQNRLN